MSNVEDFTKAVISGAVKGVMNVVDDILHPLDNIVYPITDLVHDATIIAAASIAELPVIDPTGMTADFSMLRDCIERQPSLYHDAVNNMQRRLDDMKAAGEHFMTASWQEKVEIASAMSTNILVPGFFIKGAKAIKNLHSIKTSPPLFKPYRKMRSSFDISYPTPPIKDIRKYGYDWYCGDFRYVITREKKLIITSFEYDHTTIAKGKPVYAAGEFLIDREGMLETITNSSGTFVPQGAHLKALVENAFVEYGFSEAIGKYVDLYAEWALEGERVRKPRIVNESSIIPYAAITLLGISKLPKFVNSVLAKRSSHLLDDHDSCTPHPKHFLERVMSAASFSLISGAHAAEPVDDPKIRRQPAASFESKTSHEDKMRVTATGPTAAPTNLTNDTPETEAERIAAHAVLMSQSSELTPRTTSGTYAFVAQAVNATAAQMAIYSAHEYGIREKALVNLEGAILKNALSEGTASKELFFKMHDISDAELRKLQLSSTPIGKASLPNIVSMFEYPNVMELVKNEKYTEAMYAFRDQYIAKTHISDPVLRNLRYGNWVFGVTTAALTAYQISISPNKIDESLHQGTLLSSGIIGGYEAASLAVAPCSFLGAAAPVCVAGAAFVGGILGAGAGELLWQGSKRLGKSSGSIGLISSAHAAEPAPAPNTRSRPATPFESKTSHEDRMRMTVPRPTGTSAKLANAATETEADRMAAHAAEMSKSSKVASKPAHPPKPLAKHKEVFMAARASDVETPMDNVSKHIRGNHTPEELPILRDALIRGSIKAAIAQVIPDHPAAKMGIIDPKMCRSKYKGVEQPHVDYSRAEGVYSEHFGKRFSEDSVFSRDANRIKSATSTAIPPEVSKKLLAETQSLLSAYVVNEADIISAQDLARIVNLTHHSLTTEFSSKFIKEQYKSWSEMTPEPRPGVKKPSVVRPKLKPNKTASELGATLKQEAIEVSEGITAHNKRQSELKKSLNETMDPIKREQIRINIEIEHKKYIDSLENNRAVFNVLAFGAMTFLSSADRQVARKVYSVGNEAVNIAKNWSEIVKAQTLELATGIATDTVTQNYAGIAMSLFSIAGTFMNDDEGGPDPILDAINQAVAQLSKQIAELHRVVLEGFEDASRDRYVKHLQVMKAFMVLHLEQADFKRILQGFYQEGMRSQELLKRELGALGCQISDFRQLMSSNLEALRTEKVYELVERGIQAVSRGKLTESSFQEDYLNALVTKAKVIAKAPHVTGGSVDITRPSEILLNLKGTPSLQRTIYDHPAFSNINLIHNIAQRSLGGTREEPLASPVIWQICSETFIKLLNDYIDLNPNYPTTSGDKDADLKMMTELQEEGERIVKFCQQTLLKKVVTSPATVGRFWKPRLGSYTVPIPAVEENTIEILFKEYKQSLLELCDTIEKQISEYDNKLSLEALENYQSRIEKEKIEIASMPMPKLASFEYLTGLAKRTFYKGNLTRILRLGHTFASGSGTIHGDGNGTDAWHSTCTVKFKEVSKSKEAEELRTLFKSIFGITTTPPSPY